MILIGNSISPLVKSASVQLRVLYRVRQRFSPSQIFTIYKGLVRPCMEYASHVWGCSTHTALFEQSGVKSFSSHQLSSPTDWILSLNLRRNVALISIFYRCFHANCSSELANCMPLPLPRPRFTRLSSKVHPFTVQIPYTRVNQHLQSSIPVIGKLWNCLPLWLYLYFLLPVTWFFSKGEYQGTSAIEIDLDLGFSLTYYFLLSSG